MRSDHVSYFPPLPQPTGERGRKPKRGAEFAFEVAATQPVPSVTTVTAITHYGKAVATVRDRLHPLLVRRSAWAGHPKETCQSSKAPSSVFRSITSVETAAQSRSGCGGRPPAPASRRRPLDLARHRGPYPTPPCPAPRRRPPQSLGTAHPPRAPHTRARPSRISLPPRENASAGQRTESHNRGPRQANRDEEQEPRTRAPRRETGQTKPRGSRRRQQSCKNANAEETASFATEFAVASVVIADSVEPARICVCPLLALAKARPIGT